MAQEKSEREERGWIVIVARNNLHLTKKSVKSALAQDMPCSVLLFDNRSTDGTSQWVRAYNLQHGPTVQWLSYPEQLSLSEAWNFSLEIGWEYGSEHALVLNNDVEIRPDTYRLLLEHGGPFVTGVGTLPENMTAQAWIRQPSTESPHPDFSCFLIRKEVTDKVGWFEEAYYPAFFEDNDYHVRMHRAGITAVSINLPFLHHSSATLKLASPDEQDKIHEGFRSNQKRFEETYGCLPGTPEYEALFK